MKWIRCSEKLPPVGVQVVVSGICTRYDVLTLERKDSFKMKGFIWLDQDGETLEVYDSDHWIKLPEFPNRENL